MKKHYRLYFQWRKAQRTKKANSFKRKMCTNLGRLVRDVERRIVNTPEHQEYLRVILGNCKHFITQARGALECNSQKIYSPHEQHVQCIAKGKVHKKYEYGNKVSFVSTDRNNFIVGCVSHQGRPHDSKTLQSALDSVKEITGIAPEKYCSVDLGYRGHGIKKKELFVIHPKLKKLNTAEKKLRNRRGKSEYIISYVKRHCRMSRNYLKGIVGDTINALSAATAYNARLLMRELSKIYS